MNRVSQKIILSVFLLFVTLNGQDIEIKGQIMDRDTRKPIPGANILVKNTELGTSSGLNGEFSLFINELPVVISIDHIGYEKKDININNNKFIQIELDQIILPGQTINVEGTKKALNLPEGGDLEIYSIRQLEYRGFRDASEALGEIEGVHIEGSNDGTQKIRIRGSNINEVSVFIDGIKLNNAFNREANISFVDLNMLENLIVKKGGTTTLYGAGNFGGIVFIETQDPEKTYVKAKGSFGITQETDLDRVLTASVKVPYFGGNYYRSVKNRLYDGLNLYSSYFTTGGVQASLGNRVLSFKNLDLVNQIEVKNHANPANPFILAGDSLTINQINYSGNLLYLKNWYITGGQRHLKISDNLSSMQQNFDDSTQYVVIMKKWSLGDFKLTTQFEQEENIYTGGIQSVDTDNNLVKNWDETISMSHRDRGWAGILKYNLTGASENFDSMWVEIAIRRSKLNVQQEQSVIQLDSYLGLDTTNTYMDNDFNLSTQRFSFEARKDMGTLSRTYFANQGFNHNTPTLHQYMLHGNGKSKLVREERLLNNRLRNWLHPDTLAIVMGQLALNRAHQDVYPDSLKQEYVASTEAGIRIMQNPNNTIIQRWEFTAAIFMNRFNDKLVWRNFGDDIIVPDNIVNGFTFGGEIYGAVFFPHLKFSGSFGYVHPDQDILYQVLPKSSGKLNVELYWKYLNVIISNYYQGRMQSFRGMTGMVNVPPFVNTNLNITLKYQLWKADMMFTYSVQNLFDKEYTEFQNNNWSRNFDYYDSHRKLFTVKVQVEL